MLLPPEAKGHLTVSLLCGERGIRTLEELSPLTVFKTAAFNHSAISPYLCRATAR